MKAARIILNLAALLITLGGLYDVFWPGVPPNLARQLAGASDAVVLLIRELLRALGGSLISIGLTVAVLSNVGLRRAGGTWAAWTVLLLVVLAEGINAVSMYRVGTIYQVPLGFIALTSVGVVLALRAGKRR